MVANALMYKVEDTIVNAALDLGEAIVKLLKLDVIAVRAGNSCCKEKKVSYFIWIRFLKIKRFGFKIPIN